MEDLEKCQNKGEDINIPDNPKIKREAFYPDDDHNIIDPGESTRTVRVNMMKTAG